jgi:prevent-host-death family protein
VRTSSISEAKAKLSALLELVRAGETVTITDRGRPVARLVPAAGHESETDEERLARLERKGILTRGKGGKSRLLLTPPPDVGRGVLDALLRDRREGR